jgi:tetratricopeptide (TPR) repeat protein
VEAKHHPDQPQTQYLLADAYLKTGNIADARAVISQLDRLSAKDFRSLTGTGVLLARYRLYDDAIRHFEQALELNPDSDDVKFDLADAYFHVGQYSNAFDVAMKASSQCQKENAYLALLGDIYAHLGNLESAAQIFERSVDRNPDDDQAYLSLALIYLRQGSVAAARTILQNGQKRIPESGKLYWGLGVAAAMQDDPLQAARQLERAIELLPDWPAGYSTLGVLYFQSGQLAKARDVLDRFRQSTVNSSLDIDHIQQVLDNATPVEANTLTTVNKAQFLEFALSLADKTL